MTIFDILKKESVILNLKADSKEEIINELTCSLKTLKDKKKKIMAALLERESLGSTGIGDNIAIPHAKISGISKIIAAFGRTNRGVAFNSLDGKPVNFIFLIVAPENSAGAYIKVLARISKLLKNVSLRKSLLKAEDEDKLYNLIIEEDSKI